MKPAPTRENACIAFGFVFHQVKVTEKVARVTPYGYLARGDWVLKWRERAVFLLIREFSLCWHAKQGQF